MSVVKNSNWQGFEKLAEKIYHELSPVAQVKWNDSIEGADSGTVRQIDVSIRWTVDEIEYLVIVQAKNWANRADVNTVGEFASVIRDVKANGGILICKSGFSNNAKRYAKNLGIRLHNLHDAGSIEWRHELTIPILWVDRSPNVRIQFKSHYEAGDTIDRTEPGRLLGPSGSLGVSVVEWFANEWNSGRTLRVPNVTHSVRPDFNIVVPVLVSDSRRELREVEEYLIEYRVEQRAWLGRFEPNECRGIIDCLSDSFLVSHLPIGELPTERDERWEEIDDPEQVALALKGSFVTTENFGVDVGASAVLLDGIRYLGP